MARLNTATTSAAEQKATKAAEAQARKEAGENIVEEGGATYQVHESFGLTVKSRID